MSIAIGLLTCTLLVQQVYSIGVPSEVGKFNVIGDRPCVVIRGSGPAGNALDHRGGELVHYGSKKPLAYPLDGESKVVRLGTNAESKAMGRDWKVSIIGGRGGSQIVTIQAAEGQFKGWYLDCADEEETIGVDLRLMSWGNGTEVPTSGRNLAIVGIDNNGLLHIRVFDATGIRIKDTDETQIPAKPGAISFLKRRLPGWLPPHELSDSEKALVISIAGQTQPITYEGRMITFRPLVLVEKSKHITQFERYPVSK
jgi:hypothetical protein